MTLRTLLQRLSNLEKSVQSHTFVRDSRRKHLDASIILTALKALKSYLEGHAEEAALTFEGLAKELRAKRKLSELN